MTGQGEDVFKSYQADEIAVIPGGRPKPGEPLPSLLKDRPKPVRDEEPKEDPWALPQLFADDVYGDKKPDGANTEQGEKKKRPRPPLPRSWREEACRCADRSEGGAHRKRRGEGRGKGGCKAQAAAAPEVPVQPQIRRTQAR